MIVKYTAEEIFADIKKEHLRLGVNSYTDGSFEIVSEFGEIYLLVYLQEVVKLFIDLEALPDDDHEVYEKILEYILKYWIKF